MALFIVKIEQGAFVDNTLYREGEIVELEEGLDPLWGVRCDENGTALEDHSEKIRKANKINEHLARSIESNSDEATKALARENAELKAGMEDLQNQMKSLVKEIKQGQPDTKTEDTNNAPKVETPPLDEAIKQQISNAVDLLEDANDEHWTGTGEPRIAQINDLTGLDVSRADVTASNPRLRVKPAA